jgi:hypothetical protein
MTSSDPKPMAKVFRKVINPVHPQLVSSGVARGGMGKAHTENKIALIRQWMHVCRTNETAPATLSRWGDVETLPEWLREGHDETPGVYNNTL